MDCMIECRIKHNLKRKQDISNEKKVKKAKYISHKTKKAPNQLQKNLFQALTEILDHIPLDLIGIITCYVFNKIYTRGCEGSYPNGSRIWVTWNNPIGLFSDSVSNLYVVEEQKLEMFASLDEQHVLHKEIPFDILGLAIDDDGIVQERFFIVKNSIFILGETNKLYVYKNFEIKNTVSFQLFTERTQLRGLKGSVQNLIVDNMFVYIGTNSTMFFFHPQSPYNLIHKYKVRQLYEKEVVYVDDWKFTTKSESTNLFIYTLVEGNEEICVVKKLSVGEEELIIERKWSLNPPLKKKSVFRNISFQHNYLYLVYSFHIDIFPEESTKSEDLVQTLYLSDTKNTSYIGPIAILKNQLYVSVECLGTGKSKICAWS